MIYVSTFSNLLSLSHQETLESQKIFSDVCNVDKFTKLEVEDGE